MRRKLTDNSATRQKKSNSNDWKSHVLLFLPAILTLLLWGPLAQLGFVNWDDNIYVYENQVLQGKSFPEALLTPIQGNYHPFTQFTLWLDFQLYGLVPKGYHFTSLLWHCLCVALATGLAFRLLKKQVPALWIGLGFALHPLHVESFAWVSARKDLVYSACTLAALICWMAWLERKTPLRLIGLILLVLLALMAKPMAVMLPALMLVLWVWSGEGRFSKPATREWIVPAVLLIPALILALLTYQAQGENGAIRDIPGLGWTDNIQIAAYGWWWYLLKGLVPIHLSAFYPYPPVGSGLPLVFPLALVGVVLLAAVVISKARWFRPVLPGMVWMLVALLPVLQLIPAGSAVVADRYFYLAAFGWLWLAGNLIFHQALPRSLSWFLALGLLVFWTKETWQRIPVWTNGNSLFRDVLTRFPKNPTAANNLGNWLEKNGQRIESCRWYAVAVEAKPDFPQALFNLALCRQENGNLQEAIRLNLLAIQCKPEFAEAWNNLATLYGTSGKMDSARMALDKALQSKHNYAAAWNNLGLYHLISGNKDSATLCFQRSFELEPNPAGDAARNLELMRTNPTGTESQ